MAANPIRYINPDPAANVLTVGDDVLGEKIQVTTLPAHVGGVAADGSTMERPIDAGRWGLAVQDTEVRRLLELILVEMMKLNEALTHDR
jgi:hypothetical protein